MKLLRSFIISLSLYSRIPMPIVNWTPDSMSYSLCFLPFIGLLCAILLFLWFHIALILSIGSILRSAVALLIPVLISGGIHLDGFCDTADALASNQPRERKLDILKDSNTGAFALISLSFYLLLFFALYCELPLDSPTSLILALIPVLSRSLSALSAVSFKNARTDGLLAAFSNSAHLRIVRLISLLWLLSAATTMFLVHPLFAAAALAGALIAFAYFRFMAYRQFGGITGDLAGFFLQLSELSSLLAILIAYFLFPS